MASNTQQKAPLSSTTTPTTTVAAAPTTTPTPQPTRQQQLDAVRSAAAKATYSGPSAQAQSLMAQTPGGQRALARIGTQRLQASAQANQNAASMSVTSPSTSRSLSPINPEWAKANPKLAAAEQERRRISGTSQSDNPLLGDLRSRMPMNSPSVQAANVASLGKGSSSLTQNPNALKAAPTPTTQTSQQKPTAPPAPTSQSTAPTLTPQQQSLYKQAYANRNNPLAKGRIQSELNKLTPEQRKLFQQYAQSQGQGNDWSGYQFEQVVIVNHLISEGYADSEKAALKILNAMSEEWRQSILCEKPGDGKIGPTNIPWPGASKPKPKAPTIADRAKDRYAQLDAAMNYQ